MNSTTKIIAGVAVLALLFAGIGFAVEYKAETSSTGNDIGVAYISLNDGKTGADTLLIGADSNIAFNTKTVDGVVTYTLSENAINSGKLFIKNEGVTATTVDILIKENGSSAINGEDFTLTITASGGAKTGTLTENGWLVSGVPLIAAGTTATSETLSVAFGVSPTASFTQAEMDAILAVDTFTFDVTVTATVTATVTP